MSTRQGCATGLVSILWLFALGWGSALQSQSQGTSKCGSHRHGCVSSSRSRERREREEGARAQGWAGGSALLRSSLSS